MSPDVCYCFEDQELDDVAANMADVKVHRLPVVNRDKRLVGIVSLVDIALANDPTGVVTSALCGVFSAAHRPRQRGAALFRARENAL